MCDTPIFSVFMPVYNTEKYLPRALDSVLNQTFDLSKIEVVIVNDGSPNGNACDLIVEDYSKRLNIKYIKKEKNEGTFLARKMGVQYASGKYYLNLDPDDEHTNDAYTILYNTLSQHENVDFVEFQIYEMTDVVSTYTYPDCKDRTLNTLLMQDVWTSMCFRCFNTQFLKKVYAQMDDFFAVQLEDVYQSVICEFYASNKFSISNFLYKRYVGIGVSAAKHYNNYDAFMKMDMSVQNVFNHLYSFFDKNDAASYIAKVKPFYDKFYIDAFNLTSNPNVIAAILTRIDVKSIIPAIIYKIEELNKKIEIYDSLAPIARRMNTPMKFLRKCKELLLHK